MRCPGRVPGLRLPSVCCLAQVPVLSGAGRPVLCLALRACSQGPTPLLRLGTGDPGAVWRCARALSESRREASPDVWACTASTACRPGTGASSPTHPRWERGVWRAACGFREFPHTRLPEEGGLFCSSRFSSGEAPRWRPSGRRGGARRQTAPRAGGGGAGAAPAGTGRRSATGTADAAAGRCGAMQLPRLPPRAAAGHPRASTTRPAPPRPAPRRHGTPPRLHGPPPSRYGSPDAKPP